MTIREEIIEVLTVRSGLQKHEIAREVNRKTCSLSDAIARGMANGEFIQRRGVFYLGNTMFCPFCDYEFEFVEIERLQAERKIDKHCKVEHGDV